MSIQLNKPSPRQLVGNLIPLDNPLTKSASASNSEKKLKFIVGLSSNKPSTFKTSAREEENKSADLITESDDIPSPSRYQKAVRLTKPRNRTFHSMEYASLKKTNEPADVDDSEDYRKRLTTPLKTERLISEDEDPQHILGKNAVSSFYMHYKKLDKIRDINTFTQVSDATYTSFLGKSETLNLLPSKIGFIKEKGEADKIKLNHFRLGDKYAEVLSEGLKSVRGLNKIELANNRLTPAGASHLLPKLTYQTELIDLAGNSIGKIGCDHLCSIIAMKNSRLLELNLEGNKLGDYAVGQLCEAIAYNNSLRKLNIGKNFLSDNSAEKISKMLELNSTLEELYLQWNQIKSVGGMTIVNGLTSSKLKILDFSWNSLGLNGSHFAKSFSTYISSNTTLAHLDLSNNYINKQDAKIISEELKSNHTLYGFHFSGNSGYVDCKGFLVIPDDWDSLISSRVTQPPIDGAKFQPESLKHHIGNWGEYKDVCWICEGWRPVEIEWISGDSGTQDIDPIYIHISYEGYKTVFLPSKNNFKTVRMAPPNKFDYFFSIDGLQTHDEGKPCGKPENPAIKITIEGEEKEVKLAFVNTVDKSQPGQILDRDFDVVYELRDLEIKPRIPDEVYIPAEQILERPPWKFPISIFRNFKSDTQALLDECFKVDFEGTRISKLVKNPDDLEQIKKILYDVYRPLRDCYKYYATIGAPSEIWSIPLNTYTEFCNSCGIIDGKILKLSDFDRIFIATYTRTEKDKNPRNPDRALVRYQFLEGLMRISEQKYINTGTVSTYADAMRMLMSESVIPFINKFNHNQWRVERYWNEEVDTVYKSYLPVVRGIYKKYSGQKTLPGQKKFMCLEEFNRLVSEANMLTDNCGERDATLAFNLSMMNQVDELNSDRIYQMQFVEFLEALARITEKFSPPPYGFEAQNIQNGTPEATIPYEQRSNQLLHVKIEGLMPMLFSLCGNEVKEIWTLPETSIFQMTEVHGKQRFPTKKKKIFRINPTHHSSIEPYEGMNALQI